MNNQPFTPEEDQIIRELYQVQKIKKWGMIARALTEDHGRPRNARQCRDRYQKYLDPLMTAEWTVEEQKNLYKLHDDIGNKWAIIAQKFPGKYLQFQQRTDNCVKNHFYSKLRKALRHLNKVIKQHYRKQFKQMKIGVLYKIIEALEDRFKEKAVDEQIISKCFRLKYSLLDYADWPDEEVGQNLQKQYSLISQIVNFGKGYRRKSKRERRGSNHGNDMIKFPNYEKKVKASSDIEDSSEYSQVFSHVDDSSSNNSEKSEGMPLVIIEQDIRQSLNSKYSFNQIPVEKKVQPKYSEQMILRGSGMSIQSANSVEKILKDKNALQFYHPQHFIRPSNSHYSSNRSQSQKADMFDDNIRLSGGLMQIQQEEGGDEDYSIFRSHK